ncbi:LysE family translocator [Kiloniella sp. EL199]|uniref:LysE family translocator n=1 Tax=Kiloniella sp. EL199 TaxID=2107581 RepID=UPI000EA0C832|nr:LysE family translocator [Kiloniella sp. EL199]
MNELLAIASIVGVIIIGAMTPGPSFLVVAQISLANSRSHGIAASIGMGLGALVFAGLALLGLHLVFTQVVWLYAAFKIFGGLYLLYLGIKIWRGAKNKLITKEEGATPQAVQSLTRSFYIAFMTQISNPKAALIYSGVFAVFMPAETSIWFPALLLPALLFVETGWYVLVACALSAKASRQVYLKSKSWIDRIAGGLMGALGIKLLTSNA